MTAPEDPRSKIVRLVREASEGPSPKARPPRRRAASDKPAVRIKGDGNIVGHGNVVALMPRLVRRTVVKTGDGTVSAQQKAELRRLIDEWMDRRAAIRRTKLSYGAAWSAFNKAMRVNSYHELPARDIDRACAWLRRQIGILGSMPSAPRRIPNLRANRIAAIKARCAKQLGDERAYLPYIAKHFRSTSLTELDDSQIERLYRYVMRKRV